MNAFQNLLARFQPRRIGLLIKRDVYLQYQTFLIVFGALFVVLLIAGMTAIASGASGSLNPVLFPLVLFVGGFVFTSSAFNELNHARARAFYLSLPASTAEKFFAKLLLTGPAWAIACLLVYFLFSATVSGLTGLVFGTGYELFNPLTASAWTNMGVYLIFQSVFLTGAIWFRKNAFSKTVLVVFALLLGYLAFAAAAAYVFHKVISIGGPPYIAFKIFDAAAGKDMPIPAELRALSSTMGRIFHVLFVYVMAPFLWLVSYFRLKETRG